MKICKECQHSSDIGRLYVVYGCKAPGIGRLSPVDGSQLYRSCQDERSNADGKCGPSGLKFEARQ